MLEFLATHADYGILGALVVSLIAVVKYLSKLNKDCQDTITTKLFDVVENNTKSNAELREAVREVSLKLASGGRR